MGVRLGYKQTDAGVIPEDWDIRTLGEVASIAAGGTPSRRVPEYWKDEIPWVTTTEIDFTTITHTQQSISKIGLRHSAAKLLCPGTLLLALYGQGKTRGKVAVLGIEAATNQACASILLNPSVSRDFVFHFLASRYDAIRGLSNSGSQENLNGQIVKSLLIAFPPTQAEQEAIAKALIDANALIESLEQLIAKKRNIKQGAMQELLTANRRLPSFCKEWKSVRLGELFTFKNGLNKGKEFFGQGTPIVNYMDAFQHPAIYSSMLTGRVSLTSRELSTFDVRIGDVFFTRTSETIDEVGIASVVLDEPYQTVFSGFLLRARPKNNRLHNEFKQYCFAPNYVRKQITSRASYTTRALTNGRILSAVTLGIPELDEQLAIAEMFNDIDAEISALQGKLAKARHLKQGMMQELLTGKVRLV
jgi:type I restriction enzyme S subunit